MSRTEEGGDLPIRQYGDSGEYHMDGDLVYAGKEKQLHLFKTILPILKLLEGRRVIFMVPLVRYINMACCDNSEHLTNSEEPGFEERLRSEIAASRVHYKDFLFCHGLRGFRVLDVNCCVLDNVLDEDEERCWTTDPVHPSTEGYNKIVDFMEKEFTKIKGGGQKRGRSDAGGGQSDGGGPPGKKRRLPDTRARWVESTAGPVQRLDVSRARGGGGHSYGQYGQYDDGGGNGPRGGWYRGNRGRRFPYRGRHHRGRAY
jgi:hypothetical protein